MRSLILRVSWAEYTWLEHTAKCMPRGVWSKYMMWQIVEDWLQHYVKLDTPYIRVTRFSVRNGHLFIWVNGQRVLLSVYYHQTEHRFEHVNPRGRSCIRTNRSELFEDFPSSQVPHPRARA